MDIMNRIQELLLQNKKSQRDLSSYLHVSQQVFSDWKAGRNSSYLKRLPEIADYFGVSVDYLLGKEEHPGDTGRSPDEKKYPIPGYKQPRDGADKRVMSLLDQMTEDQKRQWIALLESFLREKGIDPDTHQE